jgi:hypothetical protein
MNDRKKENEEENIIKEIQHSGFPLEIFASIILNNEGWTVRPSLDYFDKEINEYRETDIVAQQKLSSQNIDNMLIIECKKSEEKPWVFIQQKRIGYLSTNLNIAISSQNDIYYDNLEKTMIYHHYSLIPTCTYYIVPFTNDENSKLSKAIFHAKNQIISATNHLLEQQSERYKKYPELSLKTFFHPIILFDGVLYSAKIDEEGIQLKKENHLLLSVERELPEKRIIKFNPAMFADLEYKPYLIDIVKKDYFHEYLQNFGKYFDACAKDLEKCFKTYY